jgi:hypothetical protein
MSTNAYDIDPHAKDGAAEAAGEDRAAGSVGGSVPVPSAVSPADLADGGPGGAAAATAAMAGRLKQGERTRFLSKHYQLPFTPLDRHLSFDDVSSWPDDPMRVFSQWSVNNNAAAF